MYIYIVSFDKSIYGIGHFLVHLLRSVQASDEFVFQSHPLTGIACACLCLDLAIRSKYDERYQLGLHAPEMKRRKSMKVEMFHRKKYIMYTCGCMYCTHNYINYIYIHTCVCVCIYLYVSNIVPASN